MGDEFLLQVVALGDAALQGDIGVNRLALDFVGITDDRRFGDLGMGHEGAFHFRRSHAVTGDVDDVVDAAGDLIVAVLVPPAAVAGDIVAGELFEVGLLKALGIPIDAPHDARPGHLDAEGAGGHRLGEFLAFVIDEDGPDAHEGHGGHTGLDVNGAGQGGDEDAARLGLPPRIDDGAFAPADDVVVPVPGLGVDGLADGAEDAEAGDVRFLDPGVAFLGDGADGRGGRVEDVDLVLLHYLPEAAHVGVVGHAFEHYGSGAVAQRRVDDVGMSRYPADVGGAPVDVLFMVIEDHLVGVGDEGEIAAGGVDNALGLARGTGGIEDKEGIFRVHPFGGAIGGGLGHHIVPPEVAPGLEVALDLVAHALHDDHLFHRGTLGDGGVGAVLLGNGLGAPEGPVTGDQHLGG